MDSFSPCNFPEMKNYDPTTGLISISVSAVEAGLPGFGFLVAHAKLLSKK